MFRSNGIVVGVLSLVAALFIGSTAIAATAPKTKAEALAVMQKYETLAGEQEAVIQEHKGMKADYSNQVFSKNIKEARVDKMSKHCDAIIGSAQKLVDEYKAMAQWHKIYADHLQ